MDKEIIKREKFRFKSKELFYRKHGKKEEMTAKNNPESICIYIDRSRNLTVVPFYYYEDTPMGVDIGDYKLIDHPYSAEEMGNVIYSCYKETWQKPHVTNEQRAESIPSFKKITGKGFSYWIRHYECIEIRFKEQLNIHFMHKEVSGDGRGYRKCS
ncbi:MAG: hypothetical protein J6K58_14680 [Lachnospiraceae bacterium]|nr:hypothetical protein [Lachnospiraceae bacterium]